MAGTVDPVHVLGEALAVSTFVARHKPAVVAGSALALVVLLAVVAVVWDLSRRGNPAWHPLGSSSYERSEFTRKVMGLRPSEVRQLLGPPDVIDALDDGQPCWIYRKITRRTKDSDLDTAAYLVVEQGVVSQVFYQPR